MTSDGNSYGRYTYDRNGFLKRKDVGGTYHDYTPDVEGRLASVLSGGQR